MHEPLPDEIPAVGKRLPWLAIVALGGLIGLLVGGLAAAFRAALEKLDEGRIALFSALEPMTVLGWLGPMLVVGVSLLAAAELVRRFAPVAGGSGIQEVEGAPQTGKFCFL